MREKESDRMCSTEKERAKRGNGKRQIQKIRIRKRQIQKIRKRKHEGNAKILKIEGHICKYKRIYSI